MATTRTLYYIRRINAVGNVFFLGLRREWHIEWQSGIGGYKVKTYKTSRGAVTEAERLADAYRGQSVSVLFEDASGRAHVFATFTTGVDFINPATGARP